MLQRNLPKLKEKAIKLRPARRMCRVEIVNLGFPREVSNTTSYNPKTSNAATNLVAMPVVEEPSKKVVVRNHAQMDFDWASTNSNSTLASTTSMEGKKYIPVLHLQQSSAMDV